MRRRGALRAGTRVFLTLAVEKQQAAWTAVAELVWNVCGQLLEPDAFSSEVNGASAQHMNSQRYTECKNCGDMSSFTKTSKSWTAWVPRQRCITRVEPLRLTRAVPSGAGEVGPPPRSQNFRDTSLQLQPERTEAWTEPCKAIGADLPKVWGAQPLAPNKL
uniref:Uncharacterized protein n=1 Tax=Piliocolobus tephrosceles TaxID=591936 RepID=A0A8C9IDR3_9PRIM